MSPAPLPLSTALVQRYAQTQELETAWMDTATVAELERTLKGALVSNGSTGCASLHAGLYALALGTGRTLKLLQEVPWCYSTRDRVC